MKDGAYWSERSQMLFLSMEKDETTLISKLDKRYDEMLSDIDKDIASFYTKYGKNNVIEFSSLLQSADASTKKMIMESWDEFSKLYPEYSHLAPTKNAIYQLNRLQSLEQSILKTQVGIGVKNIADIENHLVKNGLLGMKLGYTAAGNEALFNTINNNVMKTLVNTDWTGSGNFKESVWTNTTKLNNYMKKDFVNGVVRGDSYESMIKILRDKYADVPKKNIRRLVYTEGTFVMNESQAQGFESNFEEYKYSARIDDKTSEICQTLNGQIFKFAEREAGMNFPPMHPGCRSTFEVVIPEDTAEPIEGVKSGI